MMFAEELRQFVSKVVNEQIQDFANHNEIPMRKSVTWRSDFSLSFGFVNP